MTRTLLSMLVLVITGCLQPGAEVERGMKQTQTFEWRTDGGYANTTVGTHEAKSLMIEGHIVMKQGEDGEPEIDWENTALTHYLLVDPSAAEAGSALAKMAEASVEQTKVFASSLGVMMELIAPIISQGLFRGSVRTKGAEVQGTASD